MHTSVIPFNPAFAALGYYHPFRTLSLSPHLQPSPPTERDPSEPLEPPQPAFVSLAWYLVDCLMSSTPLAVAVTVFTASVFLFKYGDRRWWRWSVDEVKRHLWPVSRTRALSREPVTLSQSARARASWPPRPQETEDGETSDDNQQGRKPVASISSRESTGQRHLTPWIKRKANNNNVHGEIFGILK